MQRNRLLVCVGLLVLALVAGCGGSSSSSLPGGGGGATTAPFSLTMRDDPPAGVDVISFEVNVIGATLGPNGPDLLAGKGPIEIEVKRLEVETAFLSTASVPVNSGPFSSLSLIFANPELTFQNNTKPPVTIAGCAPGAVCQVKPTGTLTANVTLNPALTISANNPTGMQVDVNLAKLLSNSLGVDFSNGSITVTQSQVQPGGELEDVDDVSGTVVKVDTGASTFDIQTSQNTTLTGIKVDNNTKFEDCTGNPVNFANCVHVNDKVEVDLKLQPDGTKVAKKIEQQNEEVNEEDLEGIITSVDTAANTIQMVAVENLSVLPSTILGSPVTVSVANNAKFQVKQKGLKVDPALVSSFNSINSLLVGQNVEVRRRSGDGSSSSSPIVTDRVRLRMSRFTAPVKSKTGANTFTVDTSGIGLFHNAKPAAIDQITVDASQAEFEPKSVTVSSLQAGDSISLRGLLFGPAANATLVAGKVRKREAQRPVSRLPGGTPRNNFGPEQITCPRPNGFYVGVIFFRQVRLRKAIRPAAASGYKLPAPAHPCPRRPRPTLSSRQCKAAPPRP